MLRLLVSLVENFEMKLSEEGFKEETTESEFYFAR